MADVRGSRQTLLTSWRCWRPVRAALVVVLALLGGGSTNPVALARGSRQGRAESQKPKTHTQKKHRKRKQHKPSIKPQIEGLVDKGSQAPYLAREPFPTADPSQPGVDGHAFAGIVVNETWAQLEPSQGRFDFSPLERSLGAVEAYDHAHKKHPLVVKLRIFGGFTAPAWAKTIGGTTPVSFSTPSASGSTGRWWTSSYRSAWSIFQHQLASRFDTDPLIASVAVTSCSTLTAEPFVESPSYALHQELFADGWSTAAQEHCLAGAFSDYSGWKYTPIDYSFNPFVAYAPDQKPVPDPGFTDQVMATCADLEATKGRSCVLSNHAFTASVGSSRSAVVYDEFNVLYAEHPGKTSIDLQTGPPDNFGGCQAIDLAIHYHARSLELWPPSANANGFKGFTAYPESELATWAAALAGQHLLSC